MIAAARRSIGPRALAATGAALAGLYCAGSVWAQPAPGGGSVYTCIDRQGRRITADRPIPECNDREQRVLDQTGAERRRLGPTLTENERAAAEAQHQREAAERARVAEERRRERVLATRYPTQSAHDAERAAALARVDDVTAVTQKHVDELLRDRKKLEAELAAYANTPGKAPMALRRQLAEQDHALDTHKRFVAAQEAEKRRLNQRFDAELAVLQPIWAAKRAAPEAAAAEH
ncbi:DUF4124 domain-containing protein [Paracidovorax wautersii]|uniref:DUF4124 domain-containing protein n=1 Tax=Paracidovorax wautersii TaxID=1177982 RepID=UPI0031E2313A